MTKKTQNLKPDIVLKNYWNNNEQFADFQEHIHYAMPMRVMGYDYGSYKKQYDSNAKKYKTAKGLSEDEYLSRMRKNDKFMPVITVVIYYGERSWDGPKSLHDMLDIPKDIIKYVNDYKML